MSFGKQAEPGRLLRQPTSLQTLFFITDLTLYQQEAISLEFYSACVSIICTDPGVMASTRGFKS